MAPLIALTGFMGSGKTSVGRRVAALLGWDFLDLDEEIVRTDGLSIPDFFAVRGETFFRVRETEILQTLVDDTAGDAGLVLALGGGTLESPGAAALIKGRGTVVYLEVDSGLAWSRVRDSGRPLARERHDFDDLLARRRGSYEDAADWVTPVQQRSVEDLAAEIADLPVIRDGLDPDVWGRRIVATGRPSLILGGGHALRALHEPPLGLRKNGSRLFVISDENVVRCLGVTVLGILGLDESSDNLLVLPPGESSKNAGVLERCWDWLAAGGARRDDIVVALGGGVVGDLAGFAAATYLRGVSLWQVPTSLLAQVDSSVGGKTGIDLGQGKNLVGAFYQPDLVIADPATLTTLAEFEYCSGLGEVVKYGLLDQGDLFAKLEDEVEVIADRDEEVIGQLVKRCVGYKARVVGVDELDKGQRAVLNLGHTTAHALEVAMGYGELSHGEAVALGLITALAVSERILGLDRSVRARTCRLLGAFGLPLLAELPDTSTLLQAASHDKKVVAGTTGFVGLRAIGDPVWGLDVPGDLLAEALEVIRA